jgi:hypothetical protein
LLGICRAKYAGVLTWQGRWEEAEKELRSAAESLQASRPPMMGDTVVRLGELRRRQGRLDEAEQLLARYHDGARRWFEESPPRAHVARSGYFGACPRIDRFRRSRTTDAHLRLARMSARPTPMSPVTDAPEADLALQRLLHLAALSAQTRRRTTMPDANETPSSEAPHQHNHEVLRMGDVSYATTSSRSTARCASR